MPAESHDVIEKRKRDRLAETGLTSMFQVIRQMASDISGVNSYISKVETALNSVNTAFKEHMVTEEAQRQEVSDRIQELSDRIDVAIKLREAFPVVEGEPDLRGHRTDHETRMESSERTDKLVDKIKEEIVTGVTRALLITFFVILGLGIKDWATSFIKSTVTTTTTTNSVSVEKKHE